MNAMTKKLHPEICSIVSIQTEPVSSVFNQMAERVESIDGQRKLIIVISHRVENTNNQTQATCRNSKHS